MPESYGQNSGTRSIDTPILWLQKMTSQPLYLQVSTHLNAQRRRNFGLARRVRVEAGPQRGVRGDERGQLVAGGPAAGVRQRPHRGHAERLGPAADGGVR